MSDDFAELVYSWSECWTPPTTLSPSQWATEYLRLPASTSTPGAVQLVSYQAALVDAVMEPDVRVCVIKAGAQLGKSLCCDILLLHAAATDPSVALHVSPADQDARKVSKTRLDPLIAQSPLLKNIVGDGGRRGGGDAANFKMWKGGGSLTLGSSHRPSDLASASAKYCFFDEVDRYKGVIKNEGDPIEIGLARQFMFPLSSKAVICSTPTDGASKIQEWFLRGDQRKFYCPCPSCRHHAVWTMNDLRWETGKPETGTIACPNCEHRLNDKERRASVDQGFWTPTAVGEKGIISFHAASVLSPFTTLEEIVTKAEAATNAVRQKSYQNLWWGEVHVEAEFMAIEPDALMERAEPIAPPYSNDIQFIVAAADLQKSRLECSFVAFLPAGRMMVLDHIVLHGPTDQDDVYTQLDEALGQTWTLEDGTELAVSIFGMDAGYRQTYAANFIRKQIAKKRRSVALRGRGKEKGKHLFDGDEIFWGKDLDVRPNLAGVPHAVIGVNIVKRGLMDRLKLDEVQPGYIHLPAHLGPEYFKSLASERLTTTYDRNGYAEYKFELNIRKGSGGGNEAIDTLSYCTALAKFCKPRNNKPRPDMAKAAAAWDPTIAKGIF